MPITFLHAADLHLDSPLRGLPDYEGAPLDRVRGASRQAFTKLIEEAVRRKVDFVVLCGDLWDGDWQDVGSGLFFARMMGELNRAQIPVFVILGNHDADNKMTRSLTLPENLRIFSTGKAETLCLEEKRIALHGQSFAVPAVEDNIALDYPAALPGWTNIGLLHTALEGDANHAKYAPCSIRDLQAKGYDYWALGHVHERRIVAEGPGGTIAYAGVLQGRHIRETGAKGALLVTIEGAEVAVESLILDVVRWHHLEIDVAGVADWKAAVRLMGDTLSQSVETADAAKDRGLLALRITLTGTTALHGRLNFDIAHLREEVRGQAAALAPDRLYIEDLRVRTSPALDPTVLAARHDALAELQALLRKAQDDEALLEELGRHLQDLLKKLPAEVRTALKEEDPERIGAIEAAQLECLLPDARTVLIDWLAPG